MENSLYNWWAGTISGCGINGDDTGKQINASIVPSKDDMKNIICPLLIVQGTADRAVDHQKAEFLKKTLKDYGKAVKLISYEGAPHQVLDNKPEAYTHVFSFLEEHLK